MGTATINNNKSKRVKREKWEKISIEEAREISQSQDPNISSILIWWRPNGGLEEKDQYCLIPSIRGEREYRLLKSA